MSASHARQLSAAAIGHRAMLDDADETPVPWWSFGKTVLAAAALRLVARGALALDENVPGEVYTLRQLLCHRSGLGDYGMLRDYHEAVARGDAPWSQSEMRERTRHLVGKRDHKFMYSNIGYSIVREMIETATGTDLQAALDDLVFGRLGISGVRVLKTTSDLATTAWGNAGGYNPGWVYHGLLAGSVGTAALLLSLLLDTEQKLMPAELLAAMRSPLPVERTPDDRPWRLDADGGYGMGLMVGIGEPPVRFEGHTGGGPGSRIAVYRANSTGLTACVAADSEDEAAVERAAMRRATAPSGRPLDDAGSV